MVAVKHHSKISTLLPCCRKKGKLSVFLQYDYEQKILQVMWIISIATAACPYMRWQRTLVSKGHYHRKKSVWTHIFQELDKSLTEPGQMINCLSLNDRSGGCNEASFILFSCICLHYRLNDLDNSTKKHGGFNTCRCGGTAHHHRDVVF